ncbi:MAG: hypothetical protein IJ679_09670 [Lachnospiraceae bacterium]|nr:hypothetical protein [Lachnospiraceae bacterium]
MENDRAFFPFIEGVAASTKIEAELHHLPDAVKKLNEFLDHVGDYHKEYVVEFEETEAFKEIFGRLDYVGAAAIGANIDEIPDNFFVTSEGLTLIDYEWVFSFPVPLRYIRFRSVYYFYVKHQSLIQRQSPEADNPNSDGGEAWFLELFGFDPEETAKWKQMEAQFQDFVHGPSHQHLYSTRYEQTIHDVNSFLNVVPDVAGEYNHLMNERQQLIDTLQLNHYIKHLWGLFKNRLHRSHK